MIDSVVSGGGMIIELEVSFYSMGFESGSNQTPNRAETEVSASEKERALSAEIAQEINQFGELSDQMSGLAEEKSLPESAKHKMHKALDEVKKKLNDTYSKIELAGLAGGVTTGSFAYIIEHGDTMIEKGSTIDTTNTVALLASLLVVLSGVVMSIKNEITDSRARKVVENGDSVMDLHKVREYVNDNLPKGYVDSKVTSEIYDDNLRTEVNQIEEINRKRIEDRAALADISRRFNSLK